MKRALRFPTTAAFVAAAALALGGATGSSLAAPRGTTFRLPPVHHVFVIALENESYASTFGDPTADPYLAQTLPSQGALLQEYYATGHESNDNYVSMVSGQPPNADNQGDCQVFSDFVYALTLGNGVEAGQGCVYPASVQNVGNQFSADGLSWKAYEEDMGNDPSRESAACGHPALNSQDRTQTAEAGDGYAARHDPFVYFHSVIDNQTYCDQHVVALGSPTGVMPPAALQGETGLATDLKKASTGRAPIRLLVLLRGAARTKLASARHHRTGRWQGRRGAALALHQAGDRVDDAVQPLLVATELGIAIRDAPPSRRRHRHVDVRA
jgi:hypothetical protein